MEYSEFLKTKMTVENIAGFEYPLEKMNPLLFEFQKFCVYRALKHGRFALFEDCGLGKSFQQLEWARIVHEHTGRPVLILAPLAVTEQTIREGEKFGISVSKYGSGNIQITNYEQLDNIDAGEFAGIVLDESSIIKNYSGETKKKIIAMFDRTPYKLACSATPAPNDPLEIGSHSEFLNQMSGKEMQATFFINDGDKANKWTLKKHSVKAFYQWMSTWAIMLNKPSDIGFEMEGYELPKLNLIERQLETTKKDNGELFNSTSVSAIDFNSELRRTKTERMNLAASIAKDLGDEQVIIWIKQNEEGEYLRRLLPDAVEVSGNDDNDVKKANLLGFAENKFRVLICKSKIAQFGLNYQNCHNQIFASLDFSFESLYQSIRRSYRFGQKRPVDIYLITTDTMGNVIGSIETKKAHFALMQNEMIDAMKQNLGNTLLRVQTEVGMQKETDRFKWINGDSIQHIQGMESDSVGLSIFSPPFSSLYVYSDSANDLSNCKTHDEFFEHFNFMVPELLRITKPGRLACLHLTQLTTLKGADGYYSIIDFRGDIIRLFQSHGWRFHAEVTIWKDPQLAAVRTKCIQLLHSQTKRDSTVSRPGLADYLVCFRKPEDEFTSEPVNYDGNGLPFELWVDYASPVWMDIDPSDTLQYRGGKGDDDVKHITPTQREIWKRAIMLWSNPGDTVFTPFGGIGTEVEQAVRLGRFGYGIELKESYYEQGLKNIEEAAKDAAEPSLF